MKTPIIFALASICVVIAGCGGSGSGGSAPAPATASAIVPIYWAQRTRSSIQSPTSALSAAITFKGAAANGGDVSFEVDRNSSPAAYTASYSTPTGVVVNTACTMVVNFHAQAGGTGPVTAVASASVEINANGVISYANGSKLGTVGTTSQLKSISVVPNQTVTVGQTLTVEVQAEDALGDVFPLTPGSVSLSLLGSNGTYAKFETNGDLLGLSVGAVTVSPQVDGITGSPGIINVLAVVILPPRSLAQATNAMVQNPVTGTFWASVPSTASSYGNNVIEVDPTTGSVLHHIYVGSEPGAIDISDDGTMLYVGLQGQNAICPVSLANFTAGTPFPLTAPSTVGLNSPEVYDLRVEPGNPNVIAITTWDTGSSGTNGPSIYDHGVARPAGLGTYDGNSLAWANPTTLYAASVEFEPSTLYQCAVTSNGAVLSKQSSDVTALDSNLRRFGTLIYSTDGTLIDGASGAVLGHFNTGGNGNGDVAVSSAHNTAVFSQLNLNDTVTIQSFNISTFALISTYTVPNLSVYANSLRGLGIYNGTGLAFRTPDHIYFIDSFSGL